MLSQTLNGYWQVRQSQFEDWLPAVVPGGVHTDLLAAGKIPDPFYGTNEEQVQWVAEKDWVYRRFFYPTPGMLAQEQVFLVCEGLDTLTDVRLNGKIIGTTDNMFRTWEWEVKAQLREGENRLEIHFHSPLDYVRLRGRIKPVGEMGMGISCASHMRKTPSHFGWDWGPKLPCMGIWRDVRLEGRSRGRLVDVRFDQQHQGGVVSLFTRVQCELWDTGEVARSDAARTIRLRVTGPDREVWQADAPARAQQSIPLTITDPKLWWPHDLGDQPLYRVEVDLLEEDRVIDSRTYHIGLRTVELHQEEDQWGKSFQFVINGAPVTIKGSNWVPVDSFPTRVTCEQVEHLVSSAKAAHQNMLRVWGGGYYESDQFYELCDRNGMLVWQDFQFACATYPLDEESYVESVIGEVVDNVRRLRHHPSLVLWCGGNEVEWMMGMMGWRKRYQAQAEACQCFFSQQLPELVAEEDPQRPYWPGSPSSGNDSVPPNSEQSGDAHLWEVYHMFRPPRYYRQQNPRFVSEFGFQSLPALETVKSFAPPKAWRLNSKEMKIHQRVPGGNAKLVWYITQRFQMPKSFEEMVYLSQVFQAEVIREGIEHWRRQPERTSGALYWQLNDCWPVSSWSSIDYTGRWKALHYAARRFFAPLMMSIVDETERGQRKMAVWLTNDRHTPWQGELRWTLETLEGEVLKGGRQPVQAAAQSAASQIQLNFSGKGERKKRVGERIKRVGERGQRIDWRRVVFVAELWQGDSCEAVRVATFVPEWKMPLNKNSITTVVQCIDDQVIVQLRAERLARFVMLDLPGARVIFSDNYFDLPAGRSVTITCPVPDGWSEEQVRAALKVRALRENGPYHSALATSWIGSQAFIENLGAVALSWIVRLLPKRP